MGNIFFTADEHFSHYNIVLHANRTPWLYPNPDYDPNKPEHFKFNNKLAVHLKSHDEALIENWNSMVKSGDLVYVLGDFAWRDHNHYIMALHGKKILILGSHDKASQEVYKNFTEVHEMACKKQINGCDYVLSHCAFRVWEKSHYNSRNLHAHSHFRLPEFNNMLQFDVGIDGWGYAPIPLEVTEKKMQLKLDWIKEHGKFAVDGESKAEGSYDKSPEKRVIETRQKNKEIMKSMGYPINDAMWPETI